MNDPVHPRERNEKHVREYAANLLYFSHAAAALIPLDDPDYPGRFVAVGTVGEIRVLLEGK